MGDRINLNLADSINELFTVGMGDESFKMLKKEILIPENCDGLREVKVNPVVWKNLSESATDTEIRLRTMQNAICKPAVKLAFIRILIHTRNLAKPGNRGLGLE